MKNIILHLWQLPQHLVAWVIIWTGAVRLADYKGRKVYAKNFRDDMKEGLSLGGYIFIDPAHAVGGSYARSEPFVAHEYGHSRQSLRWGWLYLIVVGLPSAMNMLGGRGCYYDQWTEKQANRLGGVKVTITGKRSCDFKLEMIKQ
jgi:hypothetical protein